MNDDLEHGEHDHESKIVSSTGELLFSENTRERTKERNRESQEYVSVIVKRVDETFRHPDDILEKAIDEGVEQLARPAMSLFMSALAAGMIICFTVLAVGVMTTIVGDLTSGFNRVLVALVYPLGFVMCILSRTQLFTEHTATAFYPILDRRISIFRMFRLWGIVIAGNIIGGIFSAGLLAMSDEVIHASSGYLIIAEHILSYSPLTLLISATLAGWLMALGAWTILSTHSTTSQILCIYIVTFVIGLGGLHHSIAGSVELLVGYFTSDRIALVSMIGALSVVLLGNAIGGSVFVALLNYSHIRKLNK
ncbi:formate/nitrite transporter family protein [Paraglaciecola polaris]|uniref:Formate/nitrite transporter n=1 Tax=Paraglaciecola polaris LMG 21857 TaxID=1129793 RepID=K6ZFS1_9ALTE|nr:formate/nitrite transporter family protein [Paraglaciecola polaris]GAC34866.1 formate/nitrite transporter [Paraglaciecola polaris LMG 21857]